MKIRTGFVSNSSSSCFILDYSNPEVKKLFKGRASDNSWDADKGRCTCFLKGKEVVDYVNRYVPRDDATGDWILKWARKLGEDNIVFVRESDEAMGGSIFGGEEGQYSEDPKIKEQYKKFHELVLAETEYH